MENYTLSEQSKNGHNLNGNLSGLSNSQIIERLRTLQSNNAANKQTQVKRRFLTLQLADKWFAIEAGHVQEISRLGTVTRVPLVRDHVLGVVNLRGNITAVMDVRGLFHLSRKPLDQGARVVVIKANGLEAGIVAERVSEVVDVNQDSIEPTLMTLEREVAQFFEGSFDQNGQQVTCLNPAVILALGKPA